MAASGGVRVEGLSKKLRQLKDLGLDIDDLKDVMGDLATEATQRVLRHVPKATGKLAGTLRGNRAQNKAVVRAGRAAVPYAGPINYGWPARGIAPDLFMQKGDQEMQPIAVSRVEDGIEDAIRKRGLR